MEGSLLHEVDEMEQPPSRNKNDKRVILDQERFLPIANIARIMKGMIPSSGKVSKDAKECVQECVSEFISFLTAEATDRCKADKRKTISGEDLMKALISLGFDDYVEPMELFMARYRSVMKFSNPRYTYPMTSPLLTTQVYDPNKPMSQQGPIMTVAPQHMATRDVLRGIVRTAPVQQTVYIAQAPTVAAPQQPQQQYVVAPEMDMALEPTERLMIDPQTKQHYMMVERSDGTREWVPVNIVPETYEGGEGSTAIPGIPKMDYEAVATCTPTMEPSTSSPSTSAPSHSQRTPRTPRHAQKAPREEPTGPMRVTRSATRHAQTPYSKH